MSIKMLHDFVLIKASPEKEVTSGGLLLAPSAVEKPATGTVISVGPGKYDHNGVRIDHNIEVGDTIIFSKSALNQPLEHNGEDFHVMIAEQIFGVVK